MEVELKCWNHLDEVTSSLPQVDGHGGGQRVELLLTRRSSVGGHGLILKLLNNKRLEKRVRGQQGSGGGPGLHQDFPESSSFSCTVLYRSLSPPLLPVCPVDGT